MKSWLFLWFTVFLAHSVLAQSYAVDVPEPFRTPDYVAMDPSADYCGFTAKFWGELERAGYNMINLQQAARLMSPPKVEAGAEEVLVDVYQVLSVALRVDPNVLPMKRSKLVRYLRDAGIANGADEAIQAGIGQGVFVALPEKRIAMNPDAVAPELPVKTDAPWTAPQIYRFSFNYTYRESFRCGATATELRGALNDWETGEMKCSIRFEQPSLAGRCPADIANGLINRLKQVAHYDLDVNLGPNPKEAKTIAVVGQSGTDCKGTPSDKWVERLGAELMAQYTLVDRQELDALIEEQRNDMQASAFEDSEMIEAGKLMGAEALLFGEIKCRNRQTIADIKLVSTSTGAALWTAHGENVDPSLVAAYVLHELAAVE